MGSNTTSGDLYAAFPISKFSVIIIPVKPIGLDIDIGEPVKENTQMSVECRADSANPVSSVGMQFLINGASQNNIDHQVTKTDGFDNGMVKTFVFKFTTDRSQNGRKAKCLLLWDKNPLQQREATLNITCEFNIFYTTNDPLNIFYFSHDNECSEKFFKKCWMFYHLTLKAQKSFEKSTAFCHLLQ